MATFPCHAGTPREPSVGPLPGGPGRAPGGPGRAPWTSWRVAVGLSYPHPPLTQCVKTRRALERREMARQCFTDVVFFFWRRVAFFATNRQCSRWVAQREPLERRGRFPSRKPTNMLRTRHIARRGVSTKRRLVAFYRRPASDDVNINNDPSFINSTVRNTSL